MLLAEQQQLKLALGILSGRLKIKYLGDATCATLGVSPDSLVYRKQRIRECCEHIVFRAIAGEPNH